MAEEVLELIARLAENDPRQENKAIQPCGFGLQAIEQYAANIANLDLKSGDFTDGWCGCHAIYPQWTARRLTAAYLREVAPLFDGKVRKAIESAAAEYERAQAAWQDWEKQLGNPAHAPKDAWDYPERRKRGAEAVGAAAAHERAAVGHVRDALRAIGGF